MKLQKNYFFKKYSVITAKITKKVIRYCPPLVTIVSLGCSSLLNIATRSSTKWSILLNHSYKNDMEKNTTCQVLDNDVSDQFLISDLLINF